MNSKLKSQLSRERLQRIRSGASTRIVVMCGAGISVNAGIPDFRTPGTGLYDNLQRFGLPQPQAIFELDYFRRNPEPFYMLAKEMWPDGRHKPTLSHYFIRLLHEKGLLLRCYTQNIGDAGSPHHHRLTPVPATSLC